MFVNLAKTLIFIAACICCFNIAKAQNFTTKGVEFWAAYGAHASMYKADGSTYTNGGSQKMIFYFLCNKATTVTVEIPAIGWKRTYKVTAGRTTESDEMPKMGERDIRLLQEGVSNKGIHITSEDLIAVYCHIYDEKSSATSLLIPVNISGQEYYTLGYTQESLNPNGRSYCFIIATEDSTEIEVTPAANTLGHPAGMPFFQTLNKGEVLTLFGADLEYKNGLYHGTDLSGTYIRTLVQHNNDICKKVVVFSGSTATNIVCKETTSNTSDNLFQQVPCIDNWGRNFIAVPTVNMETNRYRAIVLNPQQKVYVNGRQLTNIINNRFYEFKTDKISTIRSDSLIAVAQYITSAGQCGNEAAGEETGDPEMIYLSPNGSGITSTIIHSTRHEGIESHFINVVMKANDVDSFKLDGHSMPEVFTVYNRNPNFAIARIPVSPGRHVLVCDSGFSTYAYGYGKLVSYGYNGGYSTKHIDGYLGVHNPYKSITTTTTCTATPFRFYFDVETKLLSLYCHFNNNNHLLPNNEVWLTDPHPDTSYYVDSINTTFYRYYLPEMYQYNTVEQIPVQLTGYFPDKKGCIVKKEFSFLIDVIQKPIAQIYTAYDSCINNAIQLNDNSISYGNSKLVQWQWDFNDGKTSNEQDPLHHFNDYGEYNIQLRSINDVGCYADTMQRVGLYHSPVASFEVSGAFCDKQDVLFNSTATIQNDELTGWKWSFLPDKTIGIAPNVVKQFTDSGDYEVKLVAKSKHGCTDTATQIVHIYETPEINLPPVLYVLAGDTLRLSPTYKGNINSYKWAPDTYLSSTITPNPVASASADVTYSITAFAADGFCKATATTTVKIQQKLRIPSAFTPNGDGLNDTWRIFNIEGYANSTVEIYNRWGNRVFYSRGYPTPWNGTMNNQPLPADTYLYIIRMHTRQGNTTQSGSITIIR
ncbi:T9SS type B sorting domain-containing protein [Ilyomonas limi]|uniref:T9SS type B sorting domain-containing protein n=1 Tax=Ilyomonas limi TaxID=2575867 RepID=A0A4U3L1Z7_9BACT|nr:gliding motility-associated C-terminal domain-containing protein [Ilyomonas limi]TKK68862.1 T9SS type B sorting domain-containing protein [Ilyomonas limi]